MLPKLLNAVDIFRSLIESVAVVAPCDVTVLNRIDDVNEHAAALRAHVSPAIVP